MDNKRQRRVTMADIAEELGISTKAVSMGLNQSPGISAALREKILKTARAMHYQPNIAARGLVKNRSYLLGVILPYLHYSFWAHIVSGLEEVAEREGYGLLVASCGEGEEKLERVLSQMAGRSVDAIIALPSPETIDNYKRFLEAETISFVQVMEPCLELGNAYVCVDNVASAYTAVKHLIQLGHKEIGLISHEFEGLSMTGRSAGYRLAMEEAGININQDYHYNCLLDTDEAEKAALLLLASAPQVTAIFAASDNAALGVLRAAIRLRRRIPEDLAVIGFDDLELANQQAVHQLTTMAQPRIEIGRLAAKMAFAMIAQEAVEPIRLQADLVIRTTTVPGMQR